MPKVGETRIVWLDEQHGIGMTFFWIPPGEFRMGSRDLRHEEQPVHQVCIGESCWLAETPVTQAQYACYWPDHKNAFPNSPENPAEQVNWHEAREFCRWLTGLLADSGINGWYADLPTEAGWEYACRAGTDTAYYLGDGENALRMVGWFTGNASRTRPVQLLACNNFGLYDIHGNVWEWCRDVWHKHAYRFSPHGVRDPQLKDLSKPWLRQNRIIRGGSWSFNAHFSRASSRLGVAAKDRFDGLGFRVALYRTQTHSKNGGLERNDICTAKNSSELAQSKRARDYG